MNKRRDEDREEVRTFRKEYGKCKERKGYDMRLLSQQVTKLEDLRKEERENNRTRHPQTFPQTYQRDAIVQRFSGDLLFTYYCK